MKWVKNMAEKDKAFEFGNKNWNEVKQRNNDLMAKNGAIYEGIVGKITTRSAKTALMELKANLDAGGNPNSEENQERIREVGKVLVAKKRDFSRYVDNAKEIFSTAGLLETSSQRYGYYDTGKGTEVAVPAKIMPTPPKIRIEAEAREIGNEIIKEKADGAYRALSGNLRVIGKRDLVDALDNLHEAFNSGNMKAIKDNAAILVSRLRIQSGNFKEYLGYMKELHPESAKTVEAAGKPRKTEKT